MDNTIQAHIELIIYLIHHNKTIISTQNKNPNIIISGEGNNLVFELSSTINSNLVNLVVNRNNSANTYSKSGNKNYSLTIHEEETNLILEAIAQQQNNSQITKFGLSDIFNNRFINDINSAMEFLKTDIDIENHMHVNSFRYSFEEFNIHFETDIIYNSLSLVNVKFEYREDQIGFFQYIPINQIAQFPVIEKAILKTSYYDPLILLKSFTNDLKDENIKNVILNSELKNSILPNFNSKKIKL